MDARIRELLWALWSELGVAGSRRPPFEECAIDPEPLVVHTAALNQDARLRLEVYRWCATHGTWLSASRIRGLVRQLDPAPRDHFHTFAATLASVSRVRWPSGNATPDVLKPPSPAPELPIRRRSLVHFRLRGLCGVGTRADVLGALLCASAPIKASELALGYSKRNTARALEALADGGWAHAEKRGNAKWYRLSNGAPQPPGTGGLRWPRWGDVFELLALGCELDGAAPSPWIQGQLHYAAHHERFEALAGALELNPPPEPTEPDFDRLLTWVRAAAATVSSYGVLASAAVSPVRTTVRMPEWLGADDNWWSRLPSLLEQAQRWLAQHSAAVAGRVAEGRVLGLADWTVASSRKAWEAAELVRHGYGPAGVAALRTALEQLLLVRACQEGHASFDALLVELGDPSQRTRNRASRDALQPLWKDIPEEKLLYDMLSRWFNHVTVDTTVPRIHPLAVGPWVPYLVREQLAPRYAIFPMIAFYVVDSWIQWGSQLIGIDGPTLALDQHKPIRAYFDGCRTLYGGELSNRRPLELGILLQNIGPDRIDIGLLELSRTYALVAAAPALDRHVVLRSAGHALFGPDHRELWQTRIQRSGDQWKIRWSSASPPPLTAVVLELAAQVRPLDADFVEAMRSHLLDGVNPPTALAADRHGGTSPTAAVD